MTQKKPRNKKPSSLKKYPTIHQLNSLKMSAEKARQNSYSPYSGFKVGAALMTADKKIFNGCNVENASYGGTICAERTAILKAVSEGAKMPIQAVHVVSSGPQPWPPCGLCLQVMSEFCEASTLVMISGQSGDEKMFHFGDLLPESFNPKYLLKSKSTK